MSAPLPVNEERHDAPWTLAHRVSAGYMEPSYSLTGTITAIRVWASNAKATLWREILLGYSGTGALSSITEKQYDSGGVLHSTRTRNVVFDTTTGALLSIDG